MHAIVQLGVDATDVLLFDSGSHTLEYAAGQGFHAQPAPNTPIHLSKGHAARVILNQRPLYIPDLEKQPDDSPRSALFGPMINCQGNPMRSIVANLAPARASTSS